MSGLASLFEPEELFGTYWHHLVGDVGREPQYQDAAVALEGIRRRLEIYFRGLGGASGVEIKAIPPQSVNFRRKLLARIGNGSTLVTRARFDGDHLYLPEVIDLLPDRKSNALLYKWLTAWAASVGEEALMRGPDPLQNDISFIRYALEATRRVRDKFPGLGDIYDELKPLLLASRAPRKLPGHEAAIEASIRALLGDEEPGGEAQDIWQAINNSEIVLEGFKASTGYKTFLPVVLWGEVVSRTVNGRARREEADEDPGSSEDTEDGLTRKAQRQQSDQMEKDDPFLLHRFEAILSWAEMMNVNRATEDDEEEDAKKAAADTEQIGLANLSRKTATKLKFDLDLAPEDVEHERLAAKFTYPEWDYRKGLYYPDHCRVLAAVAPEMEEGALWEPDLEARRRIRAVKRQFEALRPRREIFHRQIDGNDIDMDALIRARCDFAVSGEASNRVFSSVRETARDLAVSVLIDTSRSSESWIEGRQVIEISKEALMALAIGLNVCGDDNAIYSFSSLRRDRVHLLTLKDYDEALGPKVFSRIGALRPGFYTRLGAAIRHVSHGLSKRGNARRLLLVLTDGKPNDLDHYEGRYGVEDTARAVREARRAGHAVFGMTIDKKAQSYFPHIFGRNAYAITRHANDLTRALPLMYRHLVS